jgi:hypothetical protein
VARDGIEPPLGSENRQVIDSTWTQKAQNTTKAGLEVHRRYTEKFLSSNSSPARHAMRIAEKRCRISGNCGPAATAVATALSRQFRDSNGIADRNELSGSTTMARFALSGSTPRKTRCPNGKFELERPNLAYETRSSNSPANPRQRPPIARVRRL